MMQDKTKNEMFYFDIISMKKYKGVTLYIEK